MSKRRGPRNKEKKWKKSPARQPSNERKKNSIDLLIDDIAYAHRGWKRRMEIYNHATQNYSYVSDKKRAEQVAEVAQEIFGGQYYCIGDAAKCQTTSE